MSEESTNRRPGDNQDEKAELGLNPPWPDL
jgi:hypothetical protein